MLHFEPRHELFRPFNLFQLILITLSLRKLIICVLVLCSYLGYLKEPLYLWVSWKVRNWLSLVYLVVWGKPRGIQILSPSSGPGGGVLLEDNVLDNIATRNYHDRAPCYWVHQRGNFLQNSSFSDFQSRMIKHPRAALWSHGNLSLFRWEDHRIAICQAFGFAINREQSSYDWVKQYFSKLYTKLNFISRIFVVTGNIIPRLSNVQFFLCLTFWNRFESPFPEYFGLNLVFWESFNLSRSSFLLN